MTRLTANRVKSEYAYKMNLGDYESFEVRVGVEADALEGESTSDAYNRVSEYVEATLMRKVEEARKEFASS